MELASLPDSKDEYWQDAEVELRHMKEPIAHTHEFKMVSSREIQCNCGFGLFIDVNDRLVDGRLYHNGELII